MRNNKSERLTPEQWAEQRKRERLQRKRDKAIKMLRDSGMTNAEIETTLKERGLDGSLNSIGSERGSHAESLEIVDAEIVDEPSNLPAVIPTVGRYEPMEAPHPTNEGRDRTNRSTIKENIDRYDSRLSEEPERRCVATNSKGQQCRRYSIPGGRVCSKHGGMAPQVVNKARVRVEMASNRLMGKLIEFAFDDDKPAHVQLDAIKDSLNRAGLKPREQLEVGPIKQYEEIFDDISTATRAESRRARGIEDTEDDVTDSIGYEHGSQIDYADSQRNSGSYPPAPATGNDAGEGLRHKAADSDCDPPSATERDDNPRRPRSYPSAHIFGDDAIRLANEANAAIGALRALPPGRSGR